MFLDLYILVDMFKILACNSWNHWSSQEVVWTQDQKISQSI